MHNPQVVSKLRDRGVEVIANDLLRPVRTIGGKQVEVDALPQQRQQLYNFQRNSRVFIKPI